MMTPPKTPSWCLADATPRHQAGVMMTPPEAPNWCHADAVQDNRPESGMASPPAADIRSAAATKGDSRAAAAPHASAPPPSRAP